MNRRLFLSAGLVSAAATRKKYRAAVIGHTGHGDYGHGLDLALHDDGFIFVRMHLGNSFRGDGGQNLRIGGSQGGSEGVPAQARAFDTRGVRSDSGQ